MMQSNSHQRLARVLHGSAELLHAAVDEARLQALACLGAPPGACTDAAVNTSSPWQGAAGQASGSSPPGAQDRDLLLGLRRHILQQLRDYALNERSLTPGDLPVLEALQADLQVVGQALASLPPAASPACAQPPGGSPHGLEYFAQRLSRERQQHTPLPCPPATAAPARHPGGSPTLAAPLLEAFSPNPTFTATVSSSTFSPASRKAALSPAAAALRKVLEEAGAGDALDISIGSAWSDGLGDGAESAAAFAAAEEQPSPRVPAAVAFDLGESEGGAAEEGGAESLTPVAQKQQRQQQQQQQQQQPEGDFVEDISYSYSSEGTPSVNLSTGSAAEEAAGAMEPAQDGVAAVPAGPSEELKGAQEAAGAVSTACAATPASASFTLSTSTPSTPSRRSSSTGLPSPFSSSKSVFEALSPVQPRHLDQSLNIVFLEEEEKLAGSVSSNSSGVLNMSLREEEEEGEETGAGGRGAAVQQQLAEARKTSPRPAYNASLYVSISDGDASGSEESGKPAALGQQQSKDDSLWGPLLDARGVIEASRRPAGTPRASPLPLHPAQHQQHQQHQQLASPQGALRAHAHSPASLSGPLARRLFQEASQSGPSSRLSSPQRPPLTPSAPHSTASPSQSASEAVRQSAAGSPSAASSSSSSSSAEASPSQTSILLTSAVKRVLLDAARLFPSKIPTTSASAAAAAAQQPAPQQQPHLAPLSPSSASARLLHSPRQYPAQRIHLPALSAPRPPSTGSAGYTASPSAAAPPALPTPDPCTPSTAATAPLTATPTPLSSAAALSALPLFRRRLAFTATPAASGSSSGASAGSSPPPSPTPLFSPPRPPRPAFTSPERAAVHAAATRDSEKARRKVQSRLARQAARLATKALADAAGAGAGAAADPAAPTPPSSRSAWLFSAPSLSAAPSATPPTQAAAPSSAASSVAILPLAWRTPVQAPVAVAAAAAGEWKSTVAALSAAKMAVAECGAGASTPPPPVEALAGGVSTPAPPLSPSAFTPSPPSSASSSTPAAAATAAAAAAAAAAAVYAVRDAPVAQQADSFSKQSMSGVQAHSIPGKAGASPSLGTRMALHLIF